MKFTVFPKIAEDRVDDQKYQIKTMLQISLLQKFTL